MNFLNKQRLSFCVWSLICWHQTAFSWGPLGHQAICDATWQMSSPDLRQLISMAAKRIGYGTFAESCTWADDIRGQDGYQWLSSLHYVNVPTNATQADQAQCWRRQNSKPTCVLQAIGYFTQRLNDSNLSERERDESLVLLSHLVGDLHQPLHVAYAEDRGGTQTKVVFKGKVLSLHRFWDTDILSCDSGKNWRILGRQVYREATKLSDNADNLLNWANESLALTRLIYRHDLQYLDDQYCRTFYPLALHRLILAARRLQILLSENL